VKWYSTKCQPMLWASFSDARLSIQVCHWFRIFPSLICADIGCWPTDRATGVSHAVPQRHDVRHLNVLPRCIHFGRGSWHQSRRGYQPGSWGQGWAKRQYGGIRCVSNLCSTTRGVGGLKGELCKTSCMLSMAGVEKFSVGFGTSSFKPDKFPLN
jgi:hypothetical protein